MTIPDKDKIVQELAKVVKVSNMNFEFDWCLHVAQACYQVIDKYLQPAGEPSEDEVERVARAVAGRNFSLKNKFNIGAIDALYLDNKDMYDDIARRAISALRNPTGEPNA